MMFLSSIMRGFSDLQRFQWQPGHFGKRIVILQNLQDRISLTISKPHLLQY